MFGDGVVDIFLVVSAIGNNRSERFLDLIQERTEFGGIVDLLAGQGRGHNRAGFRIDAQVQLPPSAAALGSMLLDSTRPARSASRECCRPAGAPVRSSSGLGEPPPASWLAGSMSNDRAPADPASSARATSRLAPQPSAAAGGIPLSGSATSRLRHPSSAPDRPAWFAVPPAKPRLLPR